MEQKFARLSVSNFCGSDQFLLLCKMTRNSSVTRRFKQHFLLLPQLLLASSGPNVIKLFTAVIRRHSMVYHDSVL